MVSAFFSYYFVAVICVRALLPFLFPEYNYVQRAFASTRRPF